MKKALPHLLCILTIIIWGVTFINTKMLLADFSPSEILAIRFLLSFLLFCVLSPKILRLKKRRHEWLFILAAFCGVFLYYYLESVALTMASATNIGVTVCCAPLFTALFATLAGQEKSLNLRFLLGFICAMLGIVLIGFGDTVPEFRSLGDLLAVCAAAVWGVYTVTVRKLLSLGYGNLAMTKRIFAWGLPMLLVALCFSGFGSDIVRFTKMENIINLLFLSVMAGVVCFLTWNHAVKELGPARTSAYLYAQPIVTATAGMILLGEALSLQMIAGFLLVVLGLLLSEGRLRIKGRD